MLARLVQRVAMLAPPRWWQRWHNAHNYPPLLTADQQHAIAHYATSHYDEDLIALRDIRQPLLGERDSGFSGSGYEFAEHRQYFRGDPVRHINWRVYARTGQLVRKVLHEQRRPQLYLVVDRRASMRFGTRRHLKVTAAVMHALKNLYQARQLQIRIGAFVLDEQLHYFPPQQGEQGTQPLIEHLVSPCPPLFGTPDNTLLAECLALLNAQLSHGNLVFIYSDFMDYHSNMDNMLHELGNRHSVIANHIVDEAEQRLPTAGYYLIQLPGSSQAIQLDCATRLARAQQQEKLRAYFNTLRQAMREAQIRYRRILASHDTWDHTTRQLQPDDSKPT